MKVTHLPVGITSFIDVVSLDVTMSTLMKYSRKDKTYRDARNTLLTGGLGNCALCGGLANETHHIKPIWACAIEYIMSFCPTSTMDARNAIYGRLPRGSEETFAEWHSLSNLVTLCPECHLKQQAADDRYWKKELAVKHRLVYTITWADPFIRAGKKSHCPQTLPDYIEWYLAKQALEL